MRFWLLYLLALGFCGCAGGKCRVVTRSVQHPVSCTASVFDASGRLQTASTNQVVRRFALTRASWSMLWTSVALSQREWDISEALNRELELGSGNAVVNVTVKASGCDFLHWYIGSLVGVVPTYARVKIEGDIVQLPTEAP